MKPTMCDPSDVSSHELEYVVKLTSYEAYPVTRVYNPLSEDEGYENEHYNVVEVDDWEESWSEIDGAEGQRVQCRNCRWVLPAKDYDEIERVGHLLHT